MAEHRTNRSQAALIYDCTLGQPSTDGVDGEQIVIDCIAETAAAVHEPRIDVYIFSLWE